MGKQVSCVKVPKWYRNIVERGRRGNKSLTKQDLVRLIKIPDGKQEVWNEVLRSEATNDQDAT